MKLAVPYIHKLQGVDARMVHLAEFLGIPCETIALEKVADPANFLARSVAKPCTCFVVTPQVLEEWVGADGVSSALVTFLLSRFTQIIVHGLRVNDFDSQLVAALSQGRLKSVEAIDEPSSAYEIAKDSKDVCEAFSGLSFGCINSANDHVMSLGGSDPAVRQLISIAGRPFMAAVKIDKLEVIFLASEDVADLNEEVDGTQLPEYFSRLLPQAMALRYAADDECWRPSNAHASIVIDDPLLRKNYGFLNFDSLLRLANEHNFHAVIAFIPHNFRRNSSRITRMFQENAARLSICFHGNDHTWAEFASTEPAFLNTLLRVAEDRMNSHQQRTGLSCDKVMVFPQGNFSVEAMQVLKSRNFYAAVNSTSCPMQQQVQLTIGELAQPAVLRHVGFPLFLRDSIQNTYSHNIAFNLFFGSPVLIVEHHDIYQHPDSLVEIAARINAILPGIRWSGLADACSNSTLSRRTSDGVYHVRAYSGTVRISNDSASKRSYLIEWGGICEDDSIDCVLMDGIPCEFHIAEMGLNLSVELAPGNSHTFSVVYRNVQANNLNLSFRWNCRAFLRRRLSEIRDNYLSKNQGILKVASAFQKRFLRV